MAASNWVERTPGDTNGATGGLECVKRGGKEGGRAGGTVDGRCEATFFYFGSRPRISFDCETESRWATPHNRVRLLIGRAVCGGDCWLTPAKLLVCAGDRVTEATWRPLLSNMSRHAESEDTPDTLDKELPGTSSTMSCIPSLGQTRFSPNGRSQGRDDGPGHRHNRPVGSYLD